MCSASHDATFLQAIAPRFFRNDIAELAAGRIAAVQIPRLLGEAECLALLGCLAGVQFDTYNPKRVNPVVDKFGPSVNDHYYDGELLQAYWDATASARRFWASASTDDTPEAICRKAFLADWPDGVTVAHRQGREMHCGIVREINSGLQVHFDDAAREFSGDLLDQTVVAQFAFNVYLSVPGEGGETIIWRRRWESEDERFRQPNSYGYHHHVVMDAQSIELQPGVGDALLFDSRHYHTVKPVKSGRRISLACFVGLTDKGDLVVWS